MDSLKPILVPSGNPILGHLSEFGREPLNFLTRCAADFGDLAELRFFNRRVFLLSQPAAVEALLMRHSTAFRKSITYRTPIMRRMFGDGIFTSEGGLWSRQRKVLQAWLSRNRTEEYLGFLSEDAEELLERWSRGGMRDIHADMLSLSAQSFGRFLVVDLDLPEREALMVAVRETQQMFARQFSWQALLGNFLPLPATLRHSHVLKHLHTRLQSRILHRRQQSVGDDYLGHLLAHRDERGRALSDGLIRDELMTLFFAGAETTALVLTWSLYLLARHPEIMARAQKEIRDTFERGTGNSLQLKLLGNIVAETMRLYPPSWVIGREAVQNCRIGDFEFNKRETVLMSQWVVHRHPGHYSEPEKFDPDRWDSSSVKKNPTFAYFPFGGGGRACPGRSFAVQAAVRALAVLLPGIRIELLDDTRIELEASITLQPRRGIPAFVNRLSEASGDGI